MNKKNFSGVLRYKDRGKLTYHIAVEKNADLRDCLELIYEDDEKKFEWHYYWDQDGLSAIAHVQAISYESLKEGFVNHLNKHGVYLHKGEYQLLKESLVIFVSHKEYIIKVCEGKEAN